MPLEATLSAPHPKPSMSRFKASRLSSPRNNASDASSSKSLPSVVPVSTSRTIQHAVKLGKLDSKNQLIGDESGSEDENDVMKEVLELLKKGEIHNIGPDGNLLHPPPAVEVPTVVPPQASIKPPKPSKFKLAASQAGRPGASRAWSSSETARSDTPISSENRSSPKLPAGDSVIERKAVGPTNVKSYPIVDSPSFLPPANPRLETVIDSPSFPRDAPTSRRPARPPMVMASSVRETTPGRQVGEDGGVPPRKVSRFLAERM